VFRQWRLDQSENVCSVSLRILVADGNREAADSMEMLLSLWGHDCRVAYSGPTALKLADSFRPHVVFSEIILPELDGYHLVGSLRAELPATLCIALTSQGQHEKTHIREAGFHFHLVKPADPDQLLELLAGVAFRAAEVPIRVG
jgi:CheY-like chemotaxis protein